MGYGQHATEIDVDYFDPSTIRKSSIIFIIGKRGSGKSTVAEDIMSYHTDIKEGICISKTDKMNEFWTKHLPPLFIHHEYNSSITYRLLSHQEDKWQKHKKACRKRGEEPKLKDIEPVFAIYDDITYDKSFLKDKATRELFMNGRHYNILIMITCQYLMDIGPDLRGQIDYVITLKDNIKNNRTKLYEYFAGVFPTFAVFDKTFVMCTDNREALVIFNSSLEHDVRKCAFFYRAKPDRQYRLGSDKYWRYSNDNYDSDSSSNSVEAQYAGMSQRDKMRAKSFDVRKHYPGDESQENGEGAYSDSSIDGDNNTFTPKERGSYADAYRDSTMAPSLLVNKRAQKKKLPPPAFRDVPSFRHNVASDEEPSDSFALIANPRERIIRGGPRVSKLAPHARRKRIKSRHTGKVRRELRTDIQDKFAPYEPFGTSILRRLDQSEGSGIIRSSKAEKRKDKQKEKKKNKKKRKAKLKAANQAKAKADQAVRRRQEFSDQLFLY